MKKTLIIIAIIFIVIIAILLGNYSNVEKLQEELTEFNLDYEQYIGEEIYGTDIATIINNAVNNNEQENIEKDEEGYYIQNDANSVEIEIKIIDLEEETIFKMETFYDGGIEQFVQYYGTILFKAEKIEYNSAGRVSYMLFEQISS